MPGNVKWFNHEKTKKMFIKELWFLQSDDKQHYIYIYKYLYLYLYLYIDIDIYKYIYMTNIP